MNKIYILIGLLLVNPMQCIAAEERALKTTCDKTEAVISTLTNRFGEVTILAGVGIGPQNKHLISVWGNPETGSYTILDTFNDISCILSVGNNIQILLQEPDTKGPEI